jgi:VanZ family protein
VGARGSIANILLYAPLGFCLILLLESRTRRVVAVLSTIAIGAFLSLCIEATQVYIVQRVPSWWDVVFNTMGALVGATAGVAWRELAGRMRTAKGGGERLGRGAAVVLLLFLAWRLAPYVPHFSLGRLKAAFAPLADPYFLTAATFHYLMWWTVVAHSVFSLVGPHRSVEALLAFIAAILASRLVISDHVFVPSELLALTLLMPTLFMLDRLTYAPRRWLLLAAFTALFLYESLAPFRMSDSAGSFDLWPFARWSDAGFPIDWEWFMRHACYFAAAIWLLKEAGMTSRAALIFVPLASLVVEIAQTWIPGRSAAVAEPLLALGIAWTMHILDARAIRPRARNH